MKQTPKGNRTNENNRNTNHKMKEKSLMDLWVYELLKEVNIKLYPQESDLELLRQTAQFFHEINTILKPQKAKT